MAKLERHYQTEILHKIRQRLPECMILKNDSGYIQGIPDWTIFYKDRWGMLEIKRSASSSIQPNQEFWVREMNNLSFAAFIFPENEEEVLDALQRALQS